MAISLSDCGLWTYWRLIENTTFVAAHAKSPGSARPGLPAFLRLRVPVAEDRAIKHFFPAILDLIESPRVNKWQFFYLIAACGLIGS
ncbi:MAG TPA: hypothetical protein VFW25_06755 [Silvibacterium sp.]|nr:hypothetical protein [Silvibacterium sp.]